MRSTAKKRKLSFLQLPEDLQDEIMDGLDSGSLTLEAARDLAASRGFAISHEAIARYHRAVRAERRVRESREQLSRAVREMALGSESLEDSIQALVRMAVGMAMQRIAEDGMELKPVDLGKMVDAAVKLAVLSAEPDGRAGSTDEPAAEPAGPKVPDAETIRRLREMLF